MSNIKNEKIKKFFPLMVIGGFIVFFVTVFTVYAGMVSIVEESRINEQFKTYSKGYNLLSQNKQVLLDSIADTQDELNNVNEEVENCKRYEALVQNPNNARFDQDGNILHYLPGFIQESFIEDGYSEKFILDAYKNFAKEQGYDIIDSKIIDANYCYGILESEGEIYSEIYTFQLENDSVSFELFHREDYQNIEANMMFSNYEMASIEINIDEITGERSDFKQLVLYYPGANNSSPNGDYKLVEHYEPTVDGYNYSLSVNDASGKELKVIEYDEVSYYIQRIWKPDSSRIVITSREIYDVESKQSYYFEKENLYVQSVTSTDDFIIMLINDGNMGSSYFRFYTWEGEFIKDDDLDILSEDKYYAVNVMVSLGDENPILLLSYYEATNDRLEFGLPIVLVYDINADKVIVYEDSMDQETSEDGEFMGYGESFYVILEKDMYSRSESQYSEGIFEEIFYDLYGQEIFRMKVDYIYEFNYIGCNEEEPILYFSKNIYDEGVEGYMIRKVNYETGEIVEHFLPEEHFAFENYDYSQLVKYKDGKFQFFVTKEFYNMEFN